MPLLAIMEQWMTIYNDEHALTADGLGLLEDSGDLGIDVDHQVLLDGDLLVAFVHLRLHPLREEVLEDGGADVGDPLLGRLGQLELGLWQVFVHADVVLSEELPDLLDAEAFISKYDEYNKSRS